MTSVTQSSLAISTSPASSKHQKAILTFPRVEMSNENDWASQKISLATQSRSPHGQLLAPNDV